MDNRRPVPVALVPLRAPGTGKSRMAPSLTVEERAGLAGAMLADVAAALRAAGLTEIVVAAGGGEASAAASALGLDVIADGEHVSGLNAAIAHATAVLGMDRDLLVVAADLPRLRAEDIDAVLTSTAQVVVAPTDDGGTGGLLRRPGGVVGPMYGPGSGRAHAAAATAAGLTCEVIDRRGFATDVDTISDLRAAAAGSALLLGPATTTFLGSSGILARLDREAG